MRVGITGAGGFIGRNLMVGLSERAAFEPVAIARDCAIDDMAQAVAGLDAIVHLAGVNRPHDDREFEIGNAGFTDRLCAAIASVDTRPMVVYASSTQATAENAYGRSKLSAEMRLRKLAECTDARVYIFRFPNVFGKWARPNYNSVVATFCNNIAHGRPIVVNDPQAPLSLLYIDNLVTLVADTLLTQPDTQDPMPIPHVHSTDVGTIGAMIHSFHDGRGKLEIAEAGSGLKRAMYATYLSYLPTDAFSYPIRSYADERGIFAEVFKTRLSGQISFLTARPGVTRGGHYHHTKVEKFLVVRGRARFRFRDLATDRSVEIMTDSENLRIVETIPGWTHDLCNVGDEDLIALLWASEIFDPARPDTYAHAL